MSILNKMGLCKMYEGQTAEELAFHKIHKKQLVDSFGQRIAEKDAKINRLAAEIERLAAEIQRLNPIVTNLSTENGSLLSDLKGSRRDLEQHQNTVNQALKENSALSERVISQHKEIQDLKRHLESTEKDYQFTTNKLKDLRDAVAHIDLCVKEAKGI